MVISSGVSERLIYINCQGGGELLIYIKTIVIRDLEIFRGEYEGKDGIWG